MTERYVVIGNPVGHSLSPLIHRLFADQMHRTLEYEALLAPLDGFVRMLQDFFGGGGSGVNVTLPLFGTLASVAIVALILAGLPVYQICFARR